MNHAVSIKAMTDDTAIVAGWGVVFGGADLEGENFARDTDYMLDLVPSKPVLYDHALRSVKHALGMVVKAEISDEGIWVEAELDRHAEYVEQVLALIEKGALGWSSGSVGHLTRREGKSIKAWPIVEWSLTPTPAEPRTLGVDVIKSLAENDPSFGALLPEAEAATSAASAEDAQIDTTETVAEQEPEMETEVKAAAPEMDVQAELKAMRDELAALKAAPPVNATPVAMPNVNTKTKPGDSEVKSFAYYMRTGDGSALKAYNNTDMNVGTDADGGYVVPTPQLNEIVARRDELSLVPKLGLRRIPGRGTTVNVPIDAEADLDFTAVNEAATIAQDAPALGEKAFTLVKYAKFITLSWELLNDEDANLMAFLSNKIGRDYAAKQNSLLITEALANGTAGLTLDAAAAIGAGEIPELEGKLMPEYQDGAAWIMHPTTYAYLRGIFGTSQFAFNPGWAGTELGFGYPVHRSSWATALAASAKSLIFGNFNFMGYREGPGMTVLRDEFSAAANGQVKLWYYFRTVFGVLQAEAIQYATHPSA